MVNDDECERCEGSGEICEFSGLPLDSCDSCGLECEILICPDCNGTGDPYMESE